jgi:(1->4)-alpha-D-glucan 1-alpha-D-glucosylmutase
VVDHSCVNPEVGGEEGRVSLVKALRHNGLGLVVDIVPNHVGVAVPSANPAWWDVLTHGRESRYAHWFDIDWSRGRLLVPVLGSGDLSDLRVEDGELRYYDHRFPIAPGTTGGSPQEVHDRQHYELVDWRRGNTEINYRRFFAIAELAAVRVEDPDVFAATHREILRWHAAGELDGIRVDHPDGLRDPGGYLADLAAAAPGAWIVVEKILEPGEELPDWPVAGTTGYDALGEACGLFVDPSAEAAFTSLAGPVDWHELIHDTKYAAATELLAAELSRLVALSPVPVERAAVAETAAAFGVYRSYLPTGFSHLREALETAQRRRPDLDFTALGEQLRDASSELAIRFQQFTGAVMAKGVEDTAFYRWTRFTALNEVGGDPARFGVPPGDFHAAQVARQSRWPGRTCAPAWPC